MDAVYKPSPAAKLEEPHSLILIGYSMADDGNGYWLAR